MSRYLDRVRQSTGSIGVGSDKSIQSGVVGDIPTGATATKSGWKGITISDTGGHGGGRSGRGDDSIYVPAFGSVLTDLNASKGVTMVGAVPYIQNFNMRFRPIDERSLVVKVTAVVREPGVVEALTLPHNDGTSL